MFIGKENLKRPKPDYNPQKEVTLKPLALGMLNFKKQVSRNQAGLLPGLSFPNREVSPSFYTYADSGIKLSSNKTVDFTKQLSRDVISTDDPKDTFLDKLIRLNLLDLGLNSTGL
jgi:hypothetical protein